MGRVKDIVKNKQKSDALVSKETVIREFGPEFRDLIEKIGESYSMSTQQSLELLVQTLQKLRPADLTTRHKKNKNNND